MSLIAPMALLGFGTLLVAKLPTMIDGRGRVVATAAALTGAAAGGVALGCAYVLPDKFLGLPDMRTLSVALIFAAGAATQSVGLLLDQALLSTIGGGMQLGRNAVQSVAKLVLLVIFAFTVARFGGLAIFTSWVVANVVSITLVGVLLLRRYELKNPARVAHPQRVGGTALRRRPAPRSQHGVDGALLRDADRRQLHSRRETGCLLLRHLVGRQCRISAAAVAGHGPIRL